MRCADRRLVSTKFKTGFAIIVICMQEKWSVNDLLWETSGDIFMLLMQLTRFEIRIQKLE
jgi:hypothetical protein